VGEVVTNILGKIQSRLTEKINKFDLFSSIELIAKPINRCNYQVLNLNQNESNYIDYLNINVKNLLKNCIYHTSCTLKNEMLERTSLTELRNYGFQNNILFVVPNIVNYEFNYSKTKKFFNKELNADYFEKDDNLFLTDVELRDSDVELQSLDHLIRGDYKIIRMKDFFNYLMFSEKA
jgi:hypothetical protein